MTARRPRLQTVPDQLRHMQRLGRRVQIAAPAIPVNAAKRPARSVRAV